MFACVASSFSQVVLDIPQGLLWKRSYWWSVCFSVKSDCWERERERGGGEGGREIRFWFLSVSFLPGSADSGFSDFTMIPLSITLMITSLRRDIRLNLFYFRSGITNRNYQWFCSLFLPIFWFAILAGIWSLTSSRIHLSGVKSSAGIPSAPGDFVIFHLFSKDRCHTLHFSVILVAWRLSSHLCQSVAFRPAFKPLIALSKRLQIIVLILHWSVLPNPCLVLLSYIIISYCQLM